MARPPNLRLESERLALTLPGPEEAGEVLAFYQANQQHHEPWDPPRPSGFYSEAYWRAQLQAARKEFEADVSLRLFLRHRDDPQGKVIGSANFTSFSRGPFQACRLGYSLDEGAVGHGYMTEGLRRALSYVFDDLGLHRVEANYIPVNERSGRVLRRLGFVVNGYARDYLFINGAWRDHVLTSLTNPAPFRP